MVERDSSTERSTDGWMDGRINELTTAAGMHPSKVEGTKSRSHWGQKRGPGKKKRKAWPGNR